MVELQRILHMARLGPIQGCGHAGEPINIQADDRYALGRAIYAVIWWRAINTTRIQTGMEDFSYFGLARALHVVGVVLWIGGVAFVTTTLIPSLRAMANVDERFALFEQLEGKFAVQARIVTLITGLTGFYMLEYMGAWDRYQQMSFWWVHMMTLIWLIFTVILFVLEPLVLHRRFKLLAIENSDKAFALLHNMHKILLALSLITIFVTVAGVHGLNMI